MLGERIRQQRKEKGLSLTQFAKQTGISKWYLSNLERGLQDNPSIEVLGENFGLLESGYRDFN